MSFMTSYSHLKSDNQSPKLSTSCIYTLFSHFSVIVFAACPVRLFYISFLYFNILHFASLINRTMFGALRCFVFGRFLGIMMSKRRNLLDLKPDGFFFVFVLRSYEAWLIIRQLVWTFCVCIFGDMTNDKTSKIETFRSTWKFKSFFVEIKAALLRLNRNRFSSCSAASNYCPMNVQCLISFPWINFQRKETIKSFQRFVFGAFVCGDERVFPDERDSSENVFHLNSSR